MIEPSKIDVIRRKHCKIHGMLTPSQCDVCYMLVEVLETQSKMYRLEEELAMSKRQRDMIKDVARAVGSRDAKS